MSGEDNSFNLWYYYLTEKTKHHYYYLNRLSWKEPTQHCTNWLQVTTLIVTLQLNVAVVTIKWYSRRHSLLTCQCVFSQVQSCIYHAATLDSTYTHMYTYVHYIKWQSIHMHDLWNGILSISVTITNTNNTWITFEDSILVSHSSEISPTAACEY